MSVNWTFFARYYAIWTFKTRKMHQNAPFQKKNSKKIMGREHSPGFTPTEEGHPSQTPTRFWPSVTRPSWPSVAGTPCHGSAPQRKLVDPRLTHCPYGVGACDGDDVRCYGVCEDVEDADDAARATVRVSSRQVRDDADRPCRPTLGTREAASRQPCISNVRLALLALVPQPPAPSWPSRMYSIKKLCLMFCMSVLSYSAVVVCVQGIRAWDIGESLLRIFGWEKYPSV